MILFVPNEAYASKCVLYRRKEESEKEAVICALLAADFPGRFFKKRHLKKAEQDLCRVFTLSLPISAFTLPYVMTLWL